MLSTIVFLVPLIGSAVLLPREPTPLEKPDDTDSPQQSLDQRFSEIRAASNGADIGELHMGDSIISSRKAQWLYGPPQAATPDTELRWTDAIIPYEIDCSLEKLKDAVSSINAAIAEWEKKTCIRFVKRTNEEKYLNFFRSTHCWAYVGMMKGSALSVGYGCEYDYVMAHELGHVIGFFHEQNRNDRDDYVTVNWDNIGRFASAFEKVKNGIYHGTPYDYSSIMHYPWAAFSSNRRDTLSPRRQRNKIPPYVQVSRYDALQTSRMYDCPTVEQKRANQLRDVTAAIELETYTPAKTRILSVPPLPGTNESMLVSMMAATPIGETRAPVGTEGCVDWSEHCNVWSEANYCRMYAIVREYCKQTCNEPVCRVGCQTKDTYPVCKAFAEDGLCCKAPYKTFMTTHCCESCKAFRKKVTPPPVPTTVKPTTTTTTTTATTTTTTTTTVKPPTPTKKPTTKPGTRKTEFLGTGKLCHDVKTQCSEWARNGQCDLNPDYMLKYCSKSCNAKDCDKPGMKPDAVCANPLGLAWDGTENYKLPHTAFRSARGALSPGGGWRASSWNARLYLTDDYERKKIGAWCSPTSDITATSMQSITVDLGVKKRITYIATQGRDKYFERVSKFKVEYSDDNINFFKYTENGDEVIFDGNCDHVTPVLNQFMEPLEARYFKYIPWRWNYPCVRMELYGCGLDDLQPEPIVVLSSPVQQDAASGGFCNESG